LGTGLIGTIAALVLGLLISSANGTYQTQSAGIEQLAANVVVLDRTLALYGTEADNIRIILRKGVIALADQIWHDRDVDLQRKKPFVENIAAELLYRDVLSGTEQSKLRSILERHVC
jgi:hypothetical protein